MSNGIIIIIIIIVVTGFFFFFSVICSARNLSLYSAPDARALYKPLIIVAMYRIIVAMYRIAVDTLHDCIAVECAENCQQA